MSTSTTVLTILLAVPAAYAFARLRLPAKRSLGFCTLATQMVPPVGLVIPYFLILNRFGWLDTYHGMIVVYLTFSLPFAIWLMVSYMEDIPRGDGGSGVSGPGEPPADRWRWCSRTTPSTRT